MRAKRFISVILSILIVCSSFAGLTVFADETNKSERTKEVAPVGADVNVPGVSATSGTTGDCTWTYEASTQTLTISGNGEMEDYYWEGHVPWYGFNTKINRVVIENGVTSIGESAFYDCTSLTSVTIPDSVMSIGYNAFYYCTSLSKIEVDENNQAYSLLNGDLYNKSQTELIRYAVGKKDNTFAFPNSVTSIGSGAFFGCTSLTSVTIPDSVTDIGEDAFRDCKSLTSVTIPDSVTFIGKDVFRGCTSLNSVTIGNGVTSIGEYAFRDCISLTSVTIPDSVKFIGDAFFDCTSLTSVTIPDSVKFIGEAFFGCTSLTSVTIPDSIKSIGEGAFGSCISLSKIEVDENNQAYSSLNGDLYNKSQTELIQYAIGKKDNTFEIPNSVTSIEWGAFFDCINLTSVTIPDSVTSIGGEAFFYCTSLTSVTIPDSVTSIGYGAFIGCTSLTSVTIPDSVTSIGDGAFSGCTSLTGVTIPDSVTSIELDAFRGCTSLTSVTIPDSVTSIGDWAFYNCTSLTSVTIPDSVTSIESNAFGYYYDDDLNEIKVQNFTIYGYKGTSAEKYAEDNEFNFVSLDTGKSVQNITGFLPKYEVTFGDKSFSLNAKAETALSYSSDNTSVAEVSTDGTVTINGAGKATITITAEETTNYKSATATVEITVNKAGQEVSVDKQNYKLTYGAKPFSLNAKAETALSYASDNTSVAEVSADGTVKIKGAGKATITINAEETANYNSATSTVKITVAKATQRVTGVKTQYVTSAGKTFILKPKAKTKLTYTSSNKNVAVVSSTGKVTVKAGGYAYITVKASENGNYKSAYVKTKIISAPKDFTSKDVSKVKKTGKTKVKITWKSLTGATGYTVQLATNKTFKGAKTVKNSKNTATLTGLKKGKTYYVRINAYTKVSGKNYSNKWYTVKFKM
ncbi:MAG: leucine-rich repeat protein [Oscillospiraceae bacterium]|nr:leucine-rich repeat protein [Oscillospiraceae bacterium]